MSDSINECNPSYDRDPSLSSLKAKLNGIKRASKSKHKDGRPLRPLSAYNIFFYMERMRVMKEQSDPNTKHAAVGFGVLASTVAAKWKEIDTVLKLELETMARLDKKRYDRENEEWKLNMLNKAGDDKALKTPSQETTFWYKSDNGINPLATNPTSVVSEGKTDTTEDKNPFLNLPIPTLPRDHDFVCGDDIRPPSVGAAVWPADRPTTHLFTSQGLVSRFPSRPTTNALDMTRNAVIGDNTYTNRDGNTYRRNSFEAIPNAKEQSSTYMRGYVDGFREATRMWEMKN